ncbi:hypothetical protein FRC08_004682 [Ceratobasidium sp. 394]|nr:hypothetical protein FRC08_004682 [Ceratobasidium sp. 394]
MIQSTSLISPGSSKSSSRQSSSQSSTYSSSTTSSSSSSKKVTWGGETVAFMDPLPPVARRKVRFLLNSFRRKLLRFGSGDLKNSSNRRTPTSHKTLHGILKPPTTRFPEHHINLGFDWSALANDLSTHASTTMNDLPPVPPLLVSTDDEETPTGSTVSTPPATDLMCDQWETASDYFSDQWEVTPKLPSEWSSPLPDYKPFSVEEQAFTLAPPSPKESPSLDVFEATEGFIEPPQPPDEPVQTPGAFVDGLASSLQHTLVICGIGFLIVSLLTIWTTILLTCGVMIASVAPAVLLAYWFLHLITRTQYSLKRIVLTAVKIGGLLGLGIGFSVLVLIDLVMDEIESLYNLAIRVLPIVAIIGVSTTVICTVLGSNIHGLIAHGISFLLSF